MKRKYTSKDVKTLPSKKRYVTKAYNKYNKSDHNLLMKLKKNIYQHEKKFIDRNLTSTLYSLSGASTITLLNGILQGTDETARIGRQLNMKSIFIRGVVNVAQTTVGQGAIRTIIVLDQEVPQVMSSGVTMSITDFLVADGVYTPNNLNNRKRFKVIMDEVVPLSGVTISTGNPNTQVIYNYKKVDITCEFNSNDNGDITDFTKNALYLVTVQDGLFTTAPAVSLYTRIRFTDN